MNLWVISHQNFWSLLGIWFFFWEQSSPRWAWSPSQRFHHDFNGDCGGCSHIYPRAIQRFPTPIRSDRDAEDELQLQQKPCEVKAGLFFCRYLHMFIVYKEYTPRIGRVYQYTTQQWINDHNQPGGRETARAFWLFASRRVTITCNLQYKMLFRTLWITEFWSKKVDATSIDF